MFRVSNLSNDFHLTFHVQPAEIETGRQHKPKPIVLTVEAHVLISLHIFLLIYIILYSCNNASDR